MYAKSGRGLIEKAFGVNFYLHYPTPLQICSVSDSDAEVWKKSNTCAHFHYPNIDPRTQQGTSPLIHVFALLEGYGMILEEFHSHRKFLSYMKRWCQNAAASAEK